MKDEANADLATYGFRSSFILPPLYFILKFARLASEIFLSGLQTVFCNNPGLSWKTAK